MVGSTARAPPTSCIRDRFIFGNRRSLRMIEGTRFRRWASIGASQIDADRCRSAICNVFSGKPCDERQLSSTSSA